MLLASWWTVWPVSFSALVSDRLRARWRAWAIYRKRWGQICALHGLTATLDDRVLLPKLAKLHVGAMVDLVTVQMLLGQSLADWQSCAEALAHAFNARDVQIRAVKPGWLQLTVRRGDALADPTPVAEPREPVDLSAVPVGVIDDGRVWTLRVLGRHILGAAETGAGKSTLVWSLLWGLGPAIRDGLVQVWAIDPKGGMELGIGQPLFRRFAYADPQAMLDLLRDAVAVMQQRAQRLRGVTRLHTPTVDEPLLLVIVDEIATLTAYGLDRKLRSEIEQALGLLLSQGRAVGVSVVACVQDPSKEVLAVRQLFPTKIALRLAEASQVPMVLGPGAREAGALCEQISADTPGVGYVVEDGHGGSNPSSGLSRHRLRHHPLDRGLRPAPRRHRGRGRPRGLTMNTRSLSTGGDQVLAAQIVARASAADYESWWAQVEHSGFCANPIHLTGKDDTGQAVTVLARCGNRRAAVCPSCSDLYAADTWQLVHAGIAGGRHGLPESIATHPMVFLTLTAPSYGPVHTRHHDNPSRSCRPRPASRVTNCEHGRPLTCRRVHNDHDSLIGQALCVDCYDYIGQTLFAWHLPELWHRFVISLRREIGRDLRSKGLPPSSLRLSYVKVAELQRRAVPHLHVLARLDHSSSDEGTSPVSAAELAGIAYRVAHRIHLTVPAPGGAIRMLRLGEQVDAQPVSYAPDDGADNDQHGTPAGRRVASYLAKYVTKSVTDLGLGPRRITEKAIDTLNVSEHVRAVLQSIVALSQDPGPTEMVRSLHTLGYRGHITTQTRHYSTTMTALRAQRNQWQTDTAANDASPSWTFAGHGHADDGERHLARTGALNAREMRRAAKEAGRPDNEHAA